MKILHRLWHSLICGCHREEHKPLWSGWARLLFPLLTALSVGWFLVRVIPKPMRATYPCQQAAFPLLSGFVIWLLGLKTALVTWLGMKWRFRKLQPLCLVAGGLLVLGLVAWAAEKAATPAISQPKALTYGSPSGDPPNSPMGVAKGIYPGRVTWIRDTNATPWDGKAGYWWQDTTGINQDAVDRMTSLSLEALTGATSDAEAWDRVFKYYNSNHGRGNVGYASNEVIAIKINLNNAVEHYETNSLSEASKQAVLALLRQLVNKAGVPQTNIAIYDAVRTLPRWLYVPCEAEFPGVQWYNSDTRSYPLQTNTWATTWVTSSSSFSVTNGCGGPLMIPSCVTQATYLINMPLLKGHIYAGVTLAAKNHYGSIPWRDHTVYLESYLTNRPLYSMLVDLMGTRLLGDKTILYINDGLYGNVRNECGNVPLTCSFSNLFNGQWSASLFMSFDPVAIDSVCLDFLYAEFGSRLGQKTATQAPIAPRCDQYLHEAALADNPPSGTLYRPDGVRLSSLGVHEHWNNPAAKQYSRNLSATGTGIELLALSSLAPAVVNLVTPTNGTVFGRGTKVCLQAVASTNYDVISRVDFYANGLFLGTGTNAPFEAVWTNPPAGNWTLTATGTDANGYGTTSGVVCVQVLGVTVAITDPVPGASVTEGTNLTIQTRALTDIGSISEVDLFANGGRLGAVTNAPYSFIWTNAPAGNWTLSATARDHTGLSATSSVVNIYIRREVQVALTQPLPGAVFMEGSNVTLRATAASPASAIRRVDFYESGRLIGTASESPYAMVCSNAAAGLWSLTAVATETAGYCATSAVVRVTIKPSHPVVAGTLYVDLRATNFSPGSVTWTNLGQLGDFAGVGTLVLEPEVAGTATPGIRFSGSSWFVGPATVPDLEGVSDRSVEVWAYQPAPLSGNATLVSFSGLGGDAYWSLCYGSDLMTGAFVGYQTFSQGSNFPSAGWNTAANIPVPDAWHHLVYVYDGTNGLSIYVDGALRVGGPYSLRSATSAPLLVGVSCDTAGTFFLPWGGYINAIRIHGGVLSSNQVLVNYLAGPREWECGPMTLLSEPADIVVPEGSDGQVSLAPAGNGGFSFQWYRDGAALAGATDSICTLTHLQWADSGTQLYCIVSRLNRCASAPTTSRTATITVQPALPAVYYCAALAEKELFGLSFSTIPGGQYQVHYKDTLDAPTWTPLSPVQTAQGTTLTVADGDSYFAIPHRFYRVVRLP
jgi:hypothetical protein